MNVLSLFDGMSCGRIALERAGIPVGTYYASEIDKYAAKVSEKNYPDIVRLGDVENWQDWDIDWTSIDLLIAGSPCQGFSFAGKQLAFDDPRSKLFFTFVDILNHLYVFNPDIKFMLENVKMKKDHLDVITGYLGVEPVFINSSLVSAQNRQQYYWANWDINQPEDKGILLKDILEEEPENYVLMSDKFVKRQEGRSCLITMEKEKASNLSAGEYVKNGRQGDYLMCSELGTPTLYGPYYRKLTPIECERLQTVPDNYTEGFSDTQRYKMLGNGWTVDVIAHIFREMKNA